MSKHTPGPWIAPQEGLVCREADWRDPLVGALAAGFQVQVSMKHGKARAEADASLIAAAPDMLVELKKCEMVFRRLSGANGPDAGIEPCVDSSLLAIADSLRDVIAKAEGRK